eukprot:gene9027-6329_t
MNPPVPVWGFGIYLPVERVRNSFDGKPSSSFCSLIFFLRYHIAFYFIILSLQKQQQLLEELPVPFIAHRLALL